MKKTRSTKSIRPKHAPPVAISAKTRRKSSKPDPVELPPTTAQVRTLENGLEVIVQEDHAHPLACVQVWIRAGSVQEEKWIGAGLAHLVEHMLFKGTERRTAAEISQAIQERGGYVNAFTSFNRTVYWIDGLSEQVDGYLDVLADMVQHSKFDAAELTREMDVIRREMSMYDDDPSSVVQELMQATAFRRHPLRHPIIGHRAVFDQVRREDVVGFVSRQYVPNNCFVVITGAVDAEAAFAMAEKHFGSWERRPYEPVLLPDEPRQQGARENRKTFNTEITRVASGWQIPGDAHEDKAALDVLAFLLGSGRSSRLFQELRERRGIAHSVWSGAWTTAECGIFAAEAECDPADLPKVREAMDAVITGMQKRGPSAAELQKAVSSTLAAQLRSLLTTRGQAMSLGQGWLAMGSLEYGRLYLERVRALTPKRIREIACRYLNSETRSIAIVEPESAVKSVANGVKQAKSDKIERFTLVNGLTLIVGENPRLPLVSLRAQFLAGVPVETESNAGVTQMTAQMLMKGTKRRSAEQIATELEGRGGSIHAVGDAHRLIVAAEVMRGDESAGLDLVSDLLLNATLPVAALEQVRKRQSASLREEMEDPLTVALRRCRREIFSGVPYARTALGTEQSIRAMKIADCRATLDAHVRTGNGVISVFGDVRAADIRRIVEKAFARLPRGNRSEAAKKDFATKGKPGAWDMKLDKEQAVLVVGFRTCGLLHPDTAALTLLDDACSDMGSRLFNRLREELGLAYYVGTQAFGAMGAGAFYFYIGTEAGKMELAEKEMMAQIADMAAHGLTGEEIKRAKTSWRSNWLRAQQGNTAMADATGWDDLNGQGYLNYRDLPALMDAVTAEQLRDTAAKYFQSNAAYVVRVLPGK